MSSKQKKLPVSDWMYHAPAKAQSKPVGAPPPSQITCLSSGEIPPPDMPPKMLIKETDSAYIRLAKKGGREDLLRMRSPKAVPTEPVGYPRVDWYYHEDIVNDQAKDTQENYEFLLPDYMVHNENHKKSEAGYRPQRLPYAQDRISVYERESDNPTDKTVKLPEVKAPGYGVRQKASNRKQPPVQAPIQKTQMCRPPSPQFGLTTSKYKPMPKPKEEDVAMGKLLSYGYLDDWQKDRDRWADRQKKLQEAAGDSRKAEKYSTEYREQMAKQGNAQTPAKAPPKSHVREISGSAKNMKAKKDEEDERPAFFKLSKFKNVPSKIEHRRPQNSLPESIPVQAAAN